jgi:Ca-activated chloride channel family protein
VLADLELDFGDLEIDDYYPQELADLFIGSQVTVVGRYNEQGRGEVRLSGKVGGKRQTFRYEVTLPQKREENDFLPRLWAARKIGYLVDQIRLHGERPELKEQIVELSKTYGVMSPYTSLLVQEDEPVALTSGRGVVVPHGAPATTLFAPGRQLLDMEAAPEVGANAVLLSKATREMKRAQVVAAPPVSKDLREVNGRILVRDSKGYWVDTAYDSSATGQRVVHLRSGSDAVVTLLTTYPKVGPFLALGDRVIFKFGEAFIKIDDTGKTRISAAELRRLIGI